MWSSLLQAGPSPVAPMPSRGGGGAGPQKLDTVPEVVNPPFFEKLLLVGGGGILMQNPCS